MFAGIVEATGIVVALRPLARHDRVPLLSEQWPVDAAMRLEIDAAGLLAGLTPGASVAVNGVCLTLVECSDSRAAFDVVPETWRRTNLHRLQPGQAVNLERSLRIGDRVDGHFVQGHIDGTGQIQRIDRTSGEFKLWITAEPRLMPFIVRKGSVALDGVSLTIVDVEQQRFSVVLIPATLERTTLGARRPGDRLNIETDILARLVVSRLEALNAVARSAPPAAGGITWEKLRESGFVS